MKPFLQSIRFILLFSIIVGVLYPLSITGVSALVFPFQSQGSILVKQGTAKGSLLIGQKFSSPKYFHGRPSSAINEAGTGYNAENSGASNFGPSNETMIKTIEQRFATVRSENDLQTTEAIPADFVQASASGLDPHISPESALLQVARIAKERNLSEQTLRTVIDKHTQQPLLGLWGQPSVNVVQLNLDLDTL